MAFAASSPRPIDVLAALMVTVGASPSLAKAIVPLMSPVAV